MTFGSVLPRKHIAATGNSSIAQDEYALLFCDDKDFKGNCQWSRYEFCTSTTMDIRSLSVARDFTCTFFANTGCETDYDFLYYKADQAEQKIVPDVNFAVNSFKCKPTTVQRDHALSDMVGSAAACNEGEVKCVGGSLRSGVIKCEKGDWKAVKLCGKEEICVDKPGPHCAPR
ncbi:hypothetical protein BKA66DRAFT_564620 [Pyrenochaeta sp. MPI-SDFR-AT-0127]|nr:hypothetical protein BKA66DRAFT_564620 [Pyrenochaeta sp. MPI-SDFR-AT-0127]